MTLCQRIFIKIGHFLVYRCAKWLQLHNPLRLLRISIIAFALFNIWLLFGSDTMADEKGKYKQLTEEDKEIIEMLDLLEDYEMITMMDIIEDLEIKDQGNNDKKGRTEGGEK